MQNLSNFSTQNISLESKYLIENLPIDQQFIIAQTLISLFGIGFAIFFGVASFKNWELDAKFMNNSRELITPQPLRFLLRLRFVIKYIKLILYSLSFIFFFVSLLSLLYFKIGNVEILKFALNLGLYSIIFGLLIIGFLILYTYTLSFVITQDELMAIINYLPEDEKQEPPP